MDITRVRQADKNNRMGVLIDELAGRNHVPGPLAVVRAEYGLKMLQKSEYGGYNAYNLIRDYLGLGDQPPYMLSMMEFCYPNLSSREDKQLSYSELNKITEEILGLVRDTVFDG